MNVDIDSDYGGSEPDEKEDNALTHIVLPRVLPLKPSDNLQTMEKDLISQMTKVIIDLNEWIPPKTVELFKNSERIYANCTPEVVSNAINRLGPGDTIAIFVRFQRCAMMIHVPQNEATNDVQNVIVATFPGSLHSSEIYDHTSDIEVIFI